MREAQVQDSSPASRPPAARPSWQRALCALLALLLVAPSALQLLGRQSEGWWLVAPLLLTAFLCARRDPTRAWLAATSLVFALPLVPVVLGLFGFQLERVLVAGVLAGWLSRGETRFETAAFGPARWLAYALCAWCAWNLGSGLRALLEHLPLATSWSSAILAAQFTDLLGYRPLTEAAVPLAAAWLQLELALLGLLGLCVAAREPELARRWSRWLVVALLLGLGVALAELWRGSNFRGESFLARLQAGLGRMHRPLPDHNSLGSALVVVLPLCAACAWSAWRERARGWCVLSLLAFALGVGLLVSTRSKAGLLGFGLALASSVCLALVLHGPRLRRAAIAFVALGGALLLGAQLLPVSLVEGLSQNRYGHDLVRVARLEALSEYLEQNRYAVWGAGGRMWSEHALLGVGLARFPAELANYRDPRLEVEFNPLHENAHNQYLQWLAELGLPGLLLGVALWGSALWGAWAGLRRGARRPSAAPLHAIAVLAALLGLALNLVVGHSLLVPAVACLWIALLVVAASSSLVQVSRELPLGPMLLGSLLLAGLCCAPGLGAPAVPLEDYELGCYPWEVSYVDGEPDSRLLAPEAAWMQRWGAGSRLILPVKDVRPWLQAGTQSIDVWLGGTRLLEAHALARSSDGSAPNPIDYLKLDAPPGVREGDLVEVRVRCALPYAGSKHFGAEQPLVGLRLFEPVFREPQPR